MAFPTPLSVTPTIVGSGLNHNINMPATVVAGDALIAIVSWSGAGAVTNPSGWVDKSIAERLCRVYAKVADGTEGGTTPNWVTGIDRSCTALVYRVEDWIEDISGIEVAAVTATVSDPDPPSLSPSWGSDDTTWIAATGQAASATLTVTAQPSGYTGFTQSNNGGGSGQATSSAYLQSATGTENPGVFTGSGGSRSAASVTIAIQPIDRRSGSGSFSATGALSGAGQKRGIGSGSFSGAAGLSGTGSKSTSGSGSFSAVASITGTGGRKESGSGSFSAVAAITGTGLKRGVGSGSFSAVAAFSGSGEGILVKAGYVRLSTKVPGLELSSSVPEMALSESVPTMELRAVLRSS